MNYREAKPAAPTHRSTPGRLDELHSVAAAKFYENGYESTSITELADEMGLSKGSLYHYISSKEDMLHAIVWRVHTAFDMELERIQAIECEPLERLGEFALSYARYVLAHHKEIAVFYQDSRHLSPDHYREIVTVRRQREQVLISILRDAAGSGQLREGVDTELAALAILGSLNWTHRWFRGSEEPEIEKIACHLAKQAVASVSEIQDARG